jgi:hypothetical protein
MFLIKFLLTRTGTITKLRSNPQDSAAFRSVSIKILNFLWYSVQCRSKYRRKESIQMYHSPGCLAMMIASLNVLESSESDILVRRFVKLPFTILKGMEFPQQWLRVA